VSKWAAPPHIAGSFTVSPYSPGLRHAACPSCRGCKHVSVAICCM